MAGYGLGFGVLHFTFLYTGMAAEIPPGPFRRPGPFTLILGALLLNEHVRGRQWLRLAVAAVGMTLVAAPGRGGTPAPLRAGVGAGQPVPAASPSHRPPAAPRPVDVGRGALRMSALSLLLEGPTAIGDSSTSLTVEHSGLDRAGAGGDRHGPGLGHLDLAAGPGGPQPHCGAVLEDAGAGGRHDTRLMAELIIEVLEIIRIDHE